MFWSKESIAGELADVCEPPLLFFIIIVILLWVFQAVCLAAFSAGPRLGWLQESMSCRHASSELYPFGGKANVGQRCPRGHTEVDVGS